MLKHTPKGPLLATYRVAVPHLTIDEYLIEAESVEDALQRWREAEPPLELNRSYTPSSGPRPRAELVVAPSSELVMPPPAVLACGVCGGGRLKPGTTDTGRAMMICQGCGAVGIGTRPLIDPS